MSLMLKFLEYRLTRFIFAGSNFFLFLGYQAKAFHRHWAFRKQHSETTPSSMDCLKKIKVCNPSNHKLHCIISHLEARILSENTSLLWYDSSRTQMPFSVRWFLEFWFKGLTVSLYKLNCYLLLLFSRPTGKPIFNKFSRIA